MYNPGLFPVAGVVLVKTIPAITATIPQATNAHLRILVRCPQRQKIQDANANGINRAYPLKHHKIQNSSWAFVCSGIWDNLSPATSSKVDPIIQAIPNAKSSIIMKIAGTKATGPRTNVRTG